MAKRSGGRAWVERWVGRWAPVLLAAAPPPLAAQPVPPSAATAPAPAPVGAVELTDSLLGQAAGRPRPARIATSVFAARADFRDIELSPSGQRFVARVSLNDKEYIRIGRLDGAEKPWLFGLPEKMDLTGYQWAGNDRLLLRVAQTVGSGERESLGTRVIIADLATRTMAVAGIGKLKTMSGDNIIWVDPDGRSMLIAMYSLNFDDLPVYRVDLATNEATLAVRPVADISRWFADTAGVVRMGIGWVDAHHWKMVYRKDATQPFEIVARGTDRDDPSGRSGRDRAIAIAADSEQGLILDEDEATGLTGVYRYDYARHQSGERLFAAPANDVSAAWASADGRSLVAATYTDSRDRVAWFDPLLADLQSALDKAVSGALGEREVWIASRSRDNSAVVVAVLASNDPGRFYLWRAGVAALTPLTARQTGLSPTLLARSHYVQYPARDGTAIAAYLTLPVGRTAKGLPLIVMPHGGPFGVRDHGDYDADVQFLANRGYAVLQPQFRGTDSYGSGFAERGDGQWGRAMQDDIDDGTDWLAKRGVIDPRRVCLVGSSYGGYAALWGATRNPERYRCAVSFAGISDMKRNLDYQLASFWDRTERERWRQRVQGEPGFDLRSISPLHMIDRLTVPVMLVHGLDDQTVQPRQSKLYADALRRAGKTHEYYEIPGEGHGFSSAANAQLWYDKLDAFLAKYNPAE